MRVKVDIKLFPKDADFVSKVSFKNIKSFVHLEQSIIAEVKRQAEVLKSGGVVAEENRRFVPAT